MNVSINGLSAQQLRRAADLKEKIETLQGELNQLIGGKAAAAPGGRRTLSPAARARIVAAQKARWAKFHAAKGKKK
jgi:hypothetical protein